MKREELFEVWAPAAAVWSPWVKPVLFSCLNEGAWDELLGMPAPPAHWCTEWLPSAAENIVLVLDLPGHEGVAVALDLARCGYRPVPLYNALPGPREQELSATGWLATPPLVEVSGILNTLRAATRRLADAGLPAEAPPAFLLDARRRVGQRLATPGCFDNRSISFVTDFPSANLLLARGMRRVLLVQRGATQPQADLAHTLRRWQDSGLEITLKDLEVAGPPAPLIVNKPTWFGLWFQRALELVGFRRNVLGGFGGILPDTSSSGG